MRQAIWAFLVIALMAVSSHVGAQIGLGMSPGEFSVRIPNSRTAGAAACGGYVGPGDINGGAIIGVAIRAWSASKCGNRFANVCVSGVCADMLTSATTGALVPKTINGTLCPAASTSACAVNDWYDQQVSNACTSASCDEVKQGTNQTGVLTTTCPPPLTACVLFPVSAGTTVLQSANNLSLVNPFTVSVFASFSGPGTGADYSTIFNNSGTIAHSGSANQIQSSCDGSAFHAAPYTDGTWASGMELCTASVMEFFLNGTETNLDAWTPTSTAYPPLVGAIVNGASISMAEMGIWPSDVSSNAPTLYNNQSIYYGLIAPPNAFFATAGLDTNNCSAQSGTPPVGPCKTIAKANSLVYAANSHIVFNGGDTFAGCLSLTPANATPNAANPITITGGAIGGYGTGRPTINTNCSGGFSAGLTLDTIRGVVVNGIDFVQGGNSPPTMAAVLITNTAGAVQSGDYLIENSTATGGFTSQGGGVSGLTGGGFTIRGFTGGCAAINNVTFRNNNIFGAAVTSADQNGIFSSDGCGPGTSGNLNNYTAEGNLLFNLGGTNPNTGTNPGNGILLIDGANQLQQFNLAHDNAWNCTVSPGCGVAFWNDQSNLATIQFSEAYHIQPGFSTGGTDFDCVDQDQGVTNGLIQYVYCHDNFGYGVTGVQADTWGPNTVRYMITENDNARTGDLTAGLISYFNNGGPGLLYIYNNVIWANHTTSPTRTGGYVNQNGWPAGGVFANNIVALTSDQFGLFTPVACVNVDATTIPQPFHHNDYNNLSGVTQQFYTCGPGGTSIAFAAWQAAIAGGDASTIQTAPGFVGSPPDAACTWTPNTIAKVSSSWPPSGCAASVALASGAQNAKSTGANLANGSWPGGAPARDFGGIAVPGTGPCYNIGADGSCP